VDYTTHKVTIFIDNKVQEQDLIREKQNMAEYLREQLQNTHITIHWEMSNDPTNKNFYTPREKFMQMAEKNPALFHLQKRLKLDLDF
jgi:DNA polymerase III subunit gamma/tau